LDADKVFEHLDMLWMGIWVPTYAVLHVQVGLNFRENGVWPHLEMLWMGAYTVTPVRVGVDFRENWGSMAEPV